MQKKKRQSIHFMLKLATEVCGGLNRRCFLSGVAIQITYEHCCLGHILDNLYIFICVFNLCINRQTEALRNVLMVSFWNNHSIHHLFTCLVTLLVGESVAILRKLQLKRYSFKENPNVVKVHLKGQHKFWEMSTLLPPTTPTMNLFLSTPHCSVWSIRQTKTDLISVQMIRIIVQTLTSAGRALFPALFKPDRLSLMPPTLILTLSLISEHIAWTKNCECYHQTGHLSYFQTLIESV